MKGNTWISFFSRGITCFSNHSFTYYDETHGLMGKKINAVIEDRGGNLLFGTREQGIFIFKQGTFSPYPIPGPGNQERLILFMHEDRRDNLWIGTGNGLYRLKNGTVRVYSTRDGLTDNYVSYIAEDSDHNPWRRVPVYHPQGNRLCKPGPG